MSIQCDSCRETVPGFDTIHYRSMETGYRDLCSRCFNLEVATLGDLDFEHVAFEPVEMRDAVGGSHHFHFRVHLLGDQVSLEAFELKESAPGGYQFQILGKAEADLFGLMGQLIERMRRTLAQQHLEKDDRFGLVIKDSLVRGRIAWDSDEEGRVPLLVIDGQDNAASSVPRHYREVRHANQERNPGIRLLSKSVANVERASRLKPM